ncbi:hypothetical protein L1O59_002327 [Salmonella enterica]|nr:hypothetical protein [Salmonella enterica]HAD5966830.1 hypothetical protein [Salmonella enterica subsp. enterica serovar Typhimurium]EAW3046005.1 hypothetical protein [Salmonella enterica]EAW3064314.1 hypothetical protein [Salmonella enterica]EBA1655302.1 hypothetical protein [Salmonella enterica]
MNTKALRPGEAWVQACDGSKNMLLQLVSGTAGFCISNTAPAQDMPYHPMPPDALIPVTTPTKVWVRSTRSYKKDTVIIASETE